MYHTIQTTNNKDINSDTIDILNQIKKQSDEISTSEGSIHLLKNLSNPTNLTNPQILGTQRTMLTNSPSPFTKKDIKLKKRNIYKARSNINIIRDELFNHQNYPKRLFQKEEKKISLKKNLIKDVLIDKEKVSCKTTKGKVKLKPIWERLRKHTITSDRERDIRINIRKSSLAKNYIASSKMISLIKYNIGIKREKYEEIKNLKDTQLLMINKTEEKISSLQKNILKDYNINYKTYLRFLNKTIDKESILKYDLNIDIYKTKNDIEKLNSKISKLIANKYYILKWIELLIQVKEKIQNVPKYYFDILEEHDNYKIYSLKDKFSKTKNFFTTDFNFLTSRRDNEEYQDIAINENDRKRIFNYKYNLIFKEPEELMAQFSKMETIWIHDLEKHQNYINEIESLKKKFIEFDESSFIEDEKLLVQKVNLVKNIYLHSKNQYDSLKGLNKKTIKKITFDKGLKKNSCLSSPNININIYDEMFNNLNFYSVRANSNKKKVITSKINKTTDILNSNNIYVLITDLFELVNKNNFIKFDTTSFVKNRNKNPIFEIMNYIEVVVNLLFEEKNKYLNDPKLKIIYKKEENNLYKEIKKRKLLKLIKLKQIKDDINLKTLQKKDFRREFYTTKKVDFSLYKKDKIFKDRKNEKKKEEIEKEIRNKEPVLEDFLYD